MLKSIGTWTKILEVGTLQYSVTKQANLQDSRMSQNKNQIYPTFKK